MATKTAYSASAQWTLPGVYNGRTGHYGEVSIEVYEDGTYGSCGWSTPNGPLSEAKSALHWLFAGDESDDSGSLLDDESLSEWLDGDRTEAVVRYDGKTYLFSEISWG